MSSAPQTIQPPERVWAEAEWDQFEREIRVAALAASPPAKAWRIIARASRRVMATYTTSFFIVSRFLPARKREMVEVVYATVRYPDEVVDSFLLSCDERLARIDRWGDAFEEALALPSMTEALAAEVPAFLAGFVEVARRTEIPPEYYRAFLEAMRRDIHPQPFQSLQELIDRYIYGSAVVVGYFLAHIYGASAPSQFTRVMECSRDLGVALQLTNFVRDVREDHRRGRLYLPLDLMHEAEADPGEFEDAENCRRIQAVIHRMAETAETLYASARSNLDAFAPDCRIAIRACIDVYGQLNRRVLDSHDCMNQRMSVPFREKWRVLPPSKYLKIPLALILR